jgi:hypothetical protein
VEKLEEQVRHHRAQLRFHEVVIQFGTSPKVRAALEQLHDNPHLRTEIAKDPASYAREKGLELPQRARLTFEEFSPRWKITITVDTNGGGGSFGYDSDGGFFCH